MKYCEKCGNKLSDSAVFCPKCGEKQSSLEEIRGVSKKTEGIENVITEGKKEESDFSQPNELEILKEKNCVKRGTIALIIAATFAVLDFFILIIFLVTDVHESLMAILLLAPSGIAKLVAAILAIVTRNTYMEILKANKSYRGKARNAKNIANAALIVVLVSGIFFLLITILAFCWDYIMLSF